MPFSKIGLFRFKTRNEGSYFVKNMDTSTIFEYPFLQAEWAGLRYQFIDIYQLNELNNCMIYNVDN